MPRKRNRPYNVDDVRFVYENYAEMTAQEIADERGLSKFQVAKIVSELRKKKIDLPKKTVKRKNPVDVFVEQLQAEKKGKK